MVKTTLRFFAAVLIAVLLTSLVSTQIILSELDGFGISVNLNDRIFTSIADLLSLGITLFIIIAPSFLIGFIIAKYVHQFFGGSRKLWYASAGFLSLPVTLYLIKYFMGMTLLASARTSWGMLSVGLCCMLAGWLFATFTPSLNLVKNANEISNEN